MSAINIPYPDYSGDKKHYAEAAKKFDTIARLITSNSRFQYDIKTLRTNFGITTDSDSDSDISFESRPYTKEASNIDISGENSSKISDELKIAINEIADRIPLDGDMSGFIREYIFQGTSDTLLLQHLRKSIVATVETTQDGTQYINLRLNGPITLKDIEATWSHIGDKIAEIYPFARDKSKIHSDNTDITWLMYDMRLTGLSDGEIADSINSSTDEDTPVFTENSIGKKLDRLTEQIDKSYR